MIEAQFPNGVEPTNYSWARAYVVTRSPASVPELDQLEADFKFFRSLTLVALVGPFELFRANAASFDGKSHAEHLHQCLSIITDLVRYAVAV